MKIDEQHPTDTLIRKPLTSSAPEAMGRHSPLRATNSPSPSLKPHRPKQLGFNTDHAPGRPRDFLGYKRLNNSRRLLFALGSRQTTELLGFPRRADRITVRKNPNQLTNKEKTVWKMRDSAKTGKPFSPGAGGNTFSRATGSR